MILHDHRKKEKSNKHPLFSFYTDPINLEIATTEKILSNKQNCNDKPPSNLTVKIDENCIIFGFESEVQCKKYRDFCHFAEDMFKKLF